MELIKSQRFPFEACLRARGAGNLLTLVSQVNEISWNLESELVFLTTGQGTIEIFSYPKLERMRSLPAHTANCFCIDFDPTGKYFAAGSAVWLCNTCVFRCLQAVGCAG
jgi:WD40 repeat protein